MDSTQHLIARLLFVVTALLQLISVMGEVKVINFSQKLDHFDQFVELNGSTFQQKILLDDSRWAGAGAPIFVLFGGEEGMTFDPEQYGILNLSVSSFNAMIIHIEHRFYGDSIPLGTIELAMADENVRACLCTDQALEDFAIIIQSLKENVSAYNSPVIVMGMGYSGALATWFRLKYNEITIGALVSSTPLYYYANTTPGDGYCSIVSKNYQDTDKKCYQFIQESWRLIDETPLSQLSRVFNTCRPLQSSDELKLALAQMYSQAAQFDIPSNQMKEYICGFIIGQGGTLSGVVRALHGQYMDPNCFDDFIANVKSPFDPLSNTTVGWAWQRCYELIFPVGCNEPTMLPSKPFDLARFKKSCQERFGIIPHPHSPISVFRSRDLVHSLTGFGGNIIFSNGLRDPLSCGGILQDLSETIVALTTTEGTSFMDFTMTSDDDPKWLKRLREEELKIFRRWIDHYNHKSMGSNLVFHNSILYILELIVFLYLYNIL